MILLLAELVKEFPFKSCAMSISSVLCLSHPNNDVPTSSTLIHSSGAARLGGYKFHKLVGPLFSVRFPFSVFFFHSTFVDVLFEYVLEYTDIQLFHHFSSGTLEKSLALSEWPFALRKIASFALRYPGSFSCNPFLERLVTFAINTHFGMSFFHDAYAHVERKIEKFMNDYHE